MRIAIIYDNPPLTPSGESWITRSAGPNGGTFLDASDDRIKDIRLIEDSLQAGGYDTIVFGNETAAGLLHFLQDERPDIIFNCCEALGGQVALEMNVAAVFELFGIPFTGAAPLALGISLDKGISKALFQAAGLKTPRYSIFDPLDAMDTVEMPPFPAIVKPIHEDASIGIDRHALVENEAALLSRVHFVWEQFGQAALAEEFIDGRELQVGLLAASPEEFLVLPIVEIKFDGLPEGTPHIMTYEAKWFVDSEVYSAIILNRKCPAELPPAVADEVRRVALAAALAVGLRDYGRIDLRLRASDNTIFVLEANLNPSLGLDTEFVRAAQASGRTHSSLVREILQRAIERNGRMATAV